MDLVRRRRSIPEIKAMLAGASYNGEPVVVFHPTDQVFFSAMIGVVAQAFRQIGLNVDEVSTDWGTVVQRRTSHAPLDKGGWSMFPVGASASEWVDPLLASGIRGNGPKALFGWSKDDQLEALREQWLDETDPMKQKQLCGQIQARCLDLVTVIPLGQYTPQTAWSRKLSMPLKGLGPVFWNITKT
jgi:peptide/nickel transport system substrate-binding protein